MASLVKTLFLSSFFSYLSASWCARNRGPVPPPKTNYKAFYKWASDDLLNECTTLTSQAGPCIPSCSSLRPWMSCPLLIGGCEALAGLGIVFDTLRLIACEYNAHTLILPVDRNAGNCLVKGSTCAPLQTSVPLRDPPQEPAKEQSDTAAADRTPTPKSVTVSPNTKRTRTVQILSHSQL